MTTNEVSQLTDTQLLAETKRIADIERRSMAELLVLLIEVDRRRLCATLGYSSLFAYCTRALGLSAQAAYSRITAARAINRIPAMLPMMTEGSLTLSSVGLLAPHLTDDNQDALLSAAQHQSTRDVAKLLACANPQPDIESSVRALSSSRMGIGHSQPPLSTRASERSVLAPLSPKRYFLKVTIGQAAHDDLERARDLLRHVVPSDDPALLVERALAQLVREAERTKHAARRRRSRASQTTPASEPSAPLAAMASRPEPHSRKVPRGKNPLSSSVVTGVRAQQFEAKSQAERDGHTTAPVLQTPAVEDCQSPTPLNTAPTRHIPAAVKRLVWARDRGQCAFVGAELRCGETAFLEFHHVIPFAARRASVADNLQLRCRSHNTHEGRLFFGAELEGANDADATKR